MPNWVTNYVVFKGKQERINELLEKIKEDGGELGSFDFNKVVPMPESLNIESGGRTDDGIELFLTAVNKDAPWFERDWVTKLGVNLEELLTKLNEEKRFRGYNPCLTSEEIKKIEVYANLNDALDLGFKACSNIMEHGATTWYQWCIKNWGTKWNITEAESSLESSNSICFNTAWSTPIPIFEKLSEMFPDVVIELKFADEDIGSNCGSFVFTAGTSEGDFMEYGEESVRFACDLWGEYPDEYLENAEE